MRVTHVITRLIVGGAQENTIASVLGLRRISGLAVDLLAGPTTGPEGSLELDFLEAGRADPSAGPRLTLIPELVRPVHPWKDFVTLRKLKTIFREHKPDIVHTHSGKAGVLGRMAAAQAKVPVIIHHIHGPSFGPFQGPLANWVFTAAERYAAKFTTHFLCSANAMTRLYLAAGIGRPEMYTRIFSGFNVEPFIKATNDPALRAQLGIPQEAFVIGKIARLFPLKGHEDLLLAFQRIVAQCPPARLLLVGDGALRLQLETRTRDLGLADKVVFTGLLPPEAVPRHVGIMDCVAHLSYREALSRALPQALAAAKPVVAYDFDGADEICLDHQTGFLVRLGHVNLVAERILLLARDPALRMQFGQCGQKFVREHFPIERMVDHIYNLYLKLAAERSCNAT